MQAAMRLPILFLCSAFFLQSIQAETLSDTDREALLNNLEKLKESVESKSGSKLRIAVLAYRNAMANDETAKELYLNCIKRVNFDQQLKKAQDFREWERQEADKNSGSGFTAALRIQLRWLVLTLEATSEKADREKLRLEAQQIVDGIFANADKLKGQEGILGQAVLSTVFAKAYEVDQVKAPDWPQAPGQLESVYNQLLLPPLRNPQRLSELRATWIRRIQQETARAEYLTRPPAPPAGPLGSRAEREERRAANDPMQNVEYVKFIQETLPRLQWEMEVDLFQSGDETAAAVRMFAHLQKYITHPSAKEWTEQLTKLLKPKPAEEPKEGTQGAP